LMAGCWTFPQQQPKKWCGLTEMETHELVWHCMITH
jgi:hypothetical protein